VSPDIPLLSNLTSLDNIALIARFHTNRPDSEIIDEINSLMETLGIADSIKSKPFVLDELTRFKVKLLRAVMFPDSVIIIDRPFYMIRNAPTIDNIRKILTLLDTRFEQCIIADYEWHRERYGDLIE